MPAFRSENETNLPHIDSNAAQVLVGTATVYAPPLRGDEYSPFPAWPNTEYNHSPQTLQFVRDNEKGSSNETQKKNL